MNITYSELNDMNQNPYQNFDYNPDISETYNKSETKNYKKSESESETYNPEKYWENSQKQIKNQSKKKKVSFDDILSNMNIVVNPNGVLQFMQPSPALQEQIYPNQEYQQPYQEYVAKQVEKKKQQPLYPSVKNSFLYNKYFKDYKDTTSYQPEVRVPKTMEEYKQMLLEDRIKSIEQKKRISEIKSKKLFFTSNIGNQGTIQSTKNNLRNMSFY
jgi:hypothetical protein